MLSKEEIEKAKKTLYPLSIGDFITWFTTDGVVKVELATETLFEYIKQVETENKELKADKYKLIEKLEKEKFTIESTYSQINGNYFMAQDKLDLISEILEILKGEK